MPLLQVAALLLGSVVAGAAFFTVATYALALRHQGRRPLLRSLAEALRELG